MRTKETNVQTTRHHGWSGIFELLSLVSKVTSELQKHLGISDKTLAEFVIAQDVQCNSLEEFEKKLEEMGADFSAEFDRECAPPSFWLCILSSKVRIVEMARRLKRRRLKRKINRQYSKALLCLTKSFLLAEGPEESKKMVDKGQSLMQSTILLLYSRAWRARQDGKAW